MKSKFESLQNQTEASYPSASVIDEIADAVMKKLGAQSFRPQAGLVDRVNAWQRARQPSRPETANITADNRPIITIDPSAVGLRPEQTEQIGNRIVPRQPMQEEWQNGFEWQQASLRMAGHFQRNRPRALFTEPENKSESPGPNIPVGSKHQITW